MSTINPRPLPASQSIRNTIGGAILLFHQLAPPSPDDAAAESAIRTAMTTIICMLRLIKVTAFPDSEIPALIRSLEVMHRTLPDAYDDAFEDAITNLRSRSLID